MARRFDYLGLLILTALIGFMAYFMVGCVSKSTHQRKLLDIQRRLDMATKKPYHKMWTDVYTLNHELKNELDGVKDVK